MFWISILKFFLALLVGGGITGVCISVSGDGEEWCYEGKCGPRYWPGKCKFGEIQSPINIIPSRTIKAKTGRRFKFNKEYYDANNFEIINNGHTVQIHMSSDETSKLIVEGAGWKGKYSFAQMHFHWGKDDTVGSEHKVKGRQFPLELHLVHAQVNGNGGLGVIGVIFGISKQDNPSLQPIIDALPSVQSVSEEAIPIETAIKLTSLFPPTWDVFRYIGSLTTPPCTEQILWSVFTQRMPISKVQVSAFREILSADETPILRNFRNIKPSKTKSRDKIFWMPVDRKKALKEAFKVVDS